jgi:predicted dinucleotide-binding enzyme
MRVGILATGDVGQALGTGFVSRGHSVRIGGRDPRNEMAADALVVKAFNTVGHAHMIDPGWDYAFKLLRK